MEDRACPLPDIGERSSINQAPARALLSVPPPGGAGTPSAARALPFAFGSCQRIAALEFAGALLEFA
jgi:hypothetical protein